MIDEYINHKTYIFIKGEKDIDKKIKFIGFLLIIFKNNKEIIINEFF